MDQGLEFTKFYLAYYAEAFEELCVCQRDGEVVYGKGFGTQECDNLVLDLNALAKTTVQNTFAKLNKLVEKGFDEQKLKQCLK